MITEGATGPQLLVRLAGAVGHRRWRSGESAPATASAPRSPSRSATSAPATRSPDPTGSHVMCTDTSARIFRRHETGAGVWSRPNAIDYRPTTSPIQLAGAAATGAKAWAAVEPNCIVAVPLEPAGGSRRRRQVRVATPSSKTRVRPCLVGPRELDDRGCISGSRAGFRLTFTTARRPRSLSVLKSRPPRGSVSARCGSWSARAATAARRIASTWPPAGRALFC